MGALEYAPAIDIGARPELLGCASACSRAIATIMSATSRSFATSRPSGDCLRHTTLLSTRVFGEHSVLVNGKGEGIGVSDLVAIGIVGGLSAYRAREIVEQVESIVAEDLQDIPQRKS